MVSGLQAVSMVMVVTVWLLHTCRTSKKTLERNKLLSSREKNYGTINNNINV